jgi:cadmium resistance protein CadD (predicted permease)
VRAKLLGWTVATLGDNLGVFMIKFMLRNTPRITLVFSVVISHLVVLHIPPSQAQKAKWTLHRRFSSSVQLNRS